MAVTISRVEWGGWKNCVQMSNGTVDLIVTADIGPRIMRYGFSGGQNFFKVFEDQLGKAGEPDWQFRGGHRVWLAPEDRVLTYAADNSPVEVETFPNKVIATQPIEPESGLRKQLEIRMAAKGTRVDVVHRMQNNRPEPFELSAWALTMLTPGGTAIAGFPPRGSHDHELAPTNPLVMWAFTNLKDPRWTFLEKFLVLRQDPSNSDHTKLGLFNPDTWGAYLLNHELFLKWCSTDATQPYPDMGCSCELFTSEVMLEVETLGPLTRLAPGEWVEHTEHWSLHRPVSVREWTDEAVEGTLSPALSERHIVGAR
jgi:hypothetical protein